MNVQSVNHTEPDNSVHVCTDLLKSLKPMLKFVSIVLTNVKLVLVLLILVPNVKTQTKDTTIHGVTVLTDFMMMVLKIQNVILVMIDVLNVLNSLTTVLNVNKTESMLQDVPANLECTKLVTPVCLVNHNVLNVK
jgi:hypothetical protein